MKTLRNLEEDAAKHDNYSFVSKDSSCADDETLCCYRYILVDTSEIRKEAIKWVKKVHSAKKGDEHYYDHDVCIWIKHFFNLTEEDLK